MKQLFVEFNLSTPGRASRAKKRIMDRFAQGDLIKVIDNNIVYEGIFMDFYWEIDENNRVKCQISQVFIGERCNEITFFDKVYVDFKNKIFKV